MEMHSQQDQKDVKHHPAPSAPSVVPRMPIVSVSFPCCRTVVRAQIHENYLEFQRSLHFAVARQGQWLSLPCSLHTQIAAVLTRRAFKVDDALEKDLIKLLRDHSWQTSWMLCYKEFSSAQKLSTPAEETQSTMPTESVEKQGTPEINSSTASVTSQSSSSAESFSSPSAAPATDFSEKIEGTPGPLATQLTWVENELEYGALLENLPRELMCMRRERTAASLERENLLLRDIIESLKKSLEEVKREVNQPKTGASPSPSPSPSPAPAAQQSESIPIKEGSCVLARFGKDWYAGKIVKRLMANGVAQFEIRYNDGDVRVKGFEDIVAAFKPGFQTTSLIHLS